MKFIIALLFPMAALADVGEIDGFGVHTLSHHAPNNGANDINLGAYVKTNKGYLLGGYYNSWHKMAYYAGWSSNEWNRMNVSIVGVTGYFAPVTFIVIPSVRLYTFDNGPTIHLSGSPVRLTEDGQSVVHLSASWRLK